MFTQIDFELVQKLFDICIGIYNFAQKRLEKKSVLGLFAGIVFLQAIHTYFRAKLT